MLAIVLISIVVQHLVSDCEAQKTVDYNVCDLQRKDVDQLHKCREDLAAVTSNFKHANDMLQLKDDCIKKDQYKENCTFSETRKVCFEHNKLIPFGSQPSEFNDIDQFPDNEADKIFVTGITLHTRRWRGHTVIGAIEVKYNASSTMFQHGAQCRDSQAVKTERFQLDSGDRITSISAFYGDMFDQLSFTTKKGRTYGPYGSTGGRTTRLSPKKPNGYLAYVAGFVTTTDSCRSVRYLNFVWGYAKDKTA